MAHACKAAGEKIPLPPPLSPRDYRHAWNDLKKNTTNIMGKALTTYTATTTSRGASTTINSNSTSSTTSTIIYTGTWFKVVLGSGCPTFTIHYYTGDHNK